MVLSPAHRPLLAAARYFVLDFPMGTHQPSWWRWLAASVVAVVGSVAACAGLAGIGPVVFPSTTGYVHFQFGDYAKLTVIGVCVACVGWAAVTLASSRAAQPLFAWAAILVTVASFAADEWILLHGQNPAAVAVLCVMHVAVAVVTYTALILIAPQRASDSGRLGTSPV